MTRSKKELGQILFLWGCSLAGDWRKAESRRAELALTLRSSRGACKTQRAQHVFNSSNEHRPESRSAKAQTILRGLVVVQKQPETRGHGIEQKE